MSVARPFDIPKELVAAAFRAVKSNAGGAGIDKETIGQFELKLGDNLYKIWNCMASGTYFPPPVKAVAIPKKSGGEIILGVPTVSDRVAQMVVKKVLDPILEPSLSSGLLSATGRRNPRWMLWKSRAGAAGSMTGFWSSISRHCSTTSSMGCC